MASAFKEYVPRETREAAAIHAISVEKMSQSAAAVKFGVSQPTLSRRLSAPIHVNSSETSQSEPAILKTPETPVSKHSTRSALRKLCRDNNAPQGLGVNGQGVTPSIARGWLKWAGIDVPPELDGKTIPYVPFDDQPVKTNDHITLTPPKPARPVLDLVESNSGPYDQYGLDDDDDPAFADKLDIDAVRAHVNSQVQQSNRPADFKRAIELLTELDRICTDAWYRRHPEPWGHDDWAHVSSEIEALHSIVGQRAEETADELLRQSSAVEVTSTPVR